MFTAENVLALGCKLGEGPIWNHREQKLYFVDILQNTIHRYHPASDVHEKTVFDVETCAMGFRKNGGLVVATKKHIAYWDGESTNLDYLLEKEADWPDNRFNDGATDRQGRFWIGTMNSNNPVGNLYRFDPDQRISTMETGVQISNGIGWSPDNAIMYYTDSPLKTIYAYDFDAATGAISNRRNHIHTPDEAGTPDGMTVDSEGYIWSARWGGYNVTRYAPDGSVDRVVEVPAEKVTSVAFGGPDFTDLYVTSAWVGHSEEQRAKDTQAGDLFRIKVDVPGLPEPDFAG